MPDLSLQQSVVLINTRPEQQAQPLTRLLEAHHYGVLALPLMYISPIHFSSSQQYKLQQQLDETDIVIFISKNAVDYFFSGFQLNGQQQIAVIGQSTATYLYEKNHKTADIVPEQGSDTEALLSELAGSALQGKRMVIVRGVGGKEQLYQELLIRQAQVSYLEVYQRGCPHYSEKKLSEMWNNDSIGFMIVSSSEAVVNFKHLIVKYRLSMWFTITMIVIHENIKNKARELGFNGDIFVTEESNNNAILKMINKLTNHRG